MDPKAAFYVPDTVVPGTLVPLDKSTLLSDARISLIFLVVQVCTCRRLPLGLLGLKKVISPLPKDIFTRKKCSYLYFKNVVLARDDSGRLLLSSLPSGYGLDFAVSILEHLITKCLVWFP